MSENYRNGAFRPAFPPDVFHPRCRADYTPAKPKSHVDSDAGDALSYAMGGNMLTEEQRKDERVRCLIAQANAGRKALEELFRLVPDQMEIKNEDNPFGRKQGEWGPLKSVYRIEYRVAPQHKEFPIKSIGNWSIQTTGNCSAIHVDDIKIGCKVFSSRLLKACLQDMSNNFHETKYTSGNVHYYFRATRAGIDHNSSDNIDQHHLLTWAEAEQLFKALSEFLK